MDKTPMDTSSTIEEKKFKKFKKTKTNKKEEDLNSKRGSKK
jgi:hypothetical protein